MPEEEPKDPAQAEGAPSANPGASSARTSSRRQSLTPELRRFLNTPRVPRPEDTSTAKMSGAPRNLDRKPAKESEPPLAATPTPNPLLTRSSRARASEKESAHGVPAPVLRAQKESRAIEMHHAVIVIGALLLLGVTFYVGTRYSYLKYLITTWHTPTISQNEADHFSGIAPDDLIREAILAEKEGRWQDAVTRFMATKRKDLGHRGILSHVGGILFHHGDYVGADKAFERSIAFGEDVDHANFYRGLIATRRHDLSAAEQFFEAAATAAPFVADYPYYCGEALRMDLKPKPSIPYYEQAALLARTDHDARIAQFKIRMARLEAVDGATVADELAKKAAEGTLPVDWLMTKAALELRAGHIGAGRAAITQAREGKSPDLFASCVNDFYFKDAARKYPELADVLHLDLDVQAPFPN